MDRLEALGFTHADHPIHRLATHLSELGRRIDEHVTQLGLVVAWLPMARQCGDRLGLRDRILVRVENPDMLRNAGWSGPTPARFRLRLDERFRCQRIDELDPPEDAPEARSQLKQPPLCEDLDEIRRMALEAMEAARGIGKWLDWGMTEAGRAETAIISDLWNVWSDVDNRWHCADGHRRAELESRPEEAIVHVYICLCPLDSNLKFESRLEEARKAIAHFKEISRRLSDHVRNLRVVALPPEDKDETLGDSKQGQPGEERHGASDRLGDNESRSTTKRQQRAEWLAKALLLVQDHPDWPDRRIAKMLGKHPSTLCRNPHYKRAAAMARGAKTDRPRGHIKVDPDTGQLDVEGYSDSDDPAEMDWDSEDPVATQHATQHRQP